MNIKNIVETFLYCLKRLHNYFSNRKYVKELLSECNHVAKLSKEQKAQVQRYYKRVYGKKLPDFLWHEYYYSVTGVFSEKYIPNYIIEELQSWMYNYYLTQAYDDKNLYYVLFPETCQPKAFLQRINGFYYLEGKNVIESEALTAVCELGEAIIKPTFCSNSGRGVKKINLHGGIEQRLHISVKELVDSYKGDFVIQECIKQHPKLSDLCSTSVNSIRVLSWRKDTEPIIVYALMRMGKQGSEIDNTTAGGLVCRIRDNGFLDKYAYSSHPTQRVEDNGSGLVFENYQVPCFDKIIRKAKELHLLMPHFEMIGWDFTVNENSDVVFIEMNAPFGYVLHQIAAGPGFGNLTDEIIQTYINPDFMINTKSSSNAKITPPFLSTIEKSRSDETKGFNQ